MKIANIENSSNITQVAWADDVLYVRFKKTGQVYRYVGVPDAEFDQLVNSESVGQYLAANIKRRYNGKPMEIPPAQMGVA